MGHVNGRTSQTDTNVKAQHIAEQARQKAAQNLLETAQRIRSFRSAETFKIARDIEISAYSLNQTSHIPSEQHRSTKPPQLRLLIVWALGFIISAIVIKRALKNNKA